MAWQVHHYRRLQIFAVAVGVTMALLSLVGGALQNRLLAQAGAAGFLAALAAVIAIGIIVGRRFG